MRLCRLLPRRVSYTCPPPPPRPAFVLRVWQVHEAIREDPALKPKPRSKPAESKRWKEAKLTYDQVGAAQPPSCRRGVCCGDRAVGGCAEEAVGGGKRRKRDELACAPGGCCRGRQPRASARCGRRRQAGVAAPAPRVAP